MAGLSQGFNEFAIDLDGDSTLEHVDAEDKPPFITDTDEGAFETGEGSASDADAVAGVEIGVGVGGEVAGDEAADGLDLVGGDGSGLPPEADDVGHAWGLEDGEEGVGVEAGEEVTTKQGEFDDLDPIRPLTAGAIDGEEGFNAARGKRPCGERLVSGFCFYGKPHPAGTLDRLGRAGFAPFSPMA